MITFDVLVCADPSPIDSVLTFTTVSDQILPFVHTFLCYVFGLLFIQLCAMVDFMLFLHLAARPSHPLPRTTTPLA